MASRGADSREFGSQSACNHVLAGTGPPPLATIHFPLPLVVASRPRRIFSLSSFEPAIAGLFALRFGELL